MNIEIDDISQAFQLTTRLKAKGVPVSFKAHQTAKGKKSACHVIVFPDDFDKTVHEEMEAMGIETGSEDVKPSKAKQVYNYYR